MFENLTGDQNMDENDENLPSTSSQKSQEENSAESDAEVKPNSNEAFNKLRNKVRKRNYRNQNNDGGENGNEATNQQTDNKNQMESEEAIEENQTQGIKKKKSESNDSGASSDEGSADNTDDQDDSNHDWSNSDEEDHSDEESPELPVLQKQPPKSTWFVVDEISNRQLGKLSSRSFQNNFYGSLRAVQKLELMYKLEEHDLCVNALGFNDTGNLLVSASDDLMITIWDWAIGKKRSAIRTHHSSNVFQSKWLPYHDDNFIVTSARDGQVRLINVKKETAQKLGSHRAAVHKISTHQDLPYLVLSAGEDAKILSIDVRDNKATRILTVQENEKPVALYSIHSNPLNSSQFCVCGHSNKVKVYDRRNTNNVLESLYPKHLEGKRSNITSAVYNHNGTEIVASYNNDDIYLFDTSTNKEEGDFAHRYQGHKNTATVKGVNFYGPQSEFIVSGSDCGNIFFWDKKNEAIVQWMHGDESGIVNVLEPHPHIPILATSGLDPDVKIWIPSREEDIDIKDNLSTCVKRNFMTRLKSNSMDDGFDGHVLWVMLRHLDRTDPPSRYSRNNYSLSDELSSNESVSESASSLTSISASDNEAEMNSSNENSSN